MSLNSHWFQSYKPSNSIDWKNDRFSTKMDVFFLIDRLWRLVSLEPVGVQRHTVAHFKALINAKVDLEAQGRGDTITGAKISERLFWSKYSVFLFSVAWGWGPLWRSFLTSTASALTHSQHIFSSHCSCFWVGKKTEYVLQKRVLLKIYHQ